MHLYLVYFIKWTTSLTNSLSERPPLPWDRRTFAVSNWPRDFQKHHKWLGKKSSSFVYVEAVFLLVASKRVEKQEVKQIRDIGGKQQKTRWWFQRLFIFTPIWGRLPFWRAYFSNGLKPPTRKSTGWCLCLFFLLPLTPLGKKTTEAKEVLGRSSCDPRGLNSPRSLEKWSNLTCAYFSKGLVQPPTR